jgi:nitroreductase
MSTPIEILSSRVSHRKLVAPAPSKEQVDAIMAVALRAPDHALLRPWRFRIYTGDALKRLGKHFAAASANADPSIDTDKLAKIEAKSLRAPMIIIVSVIVKEHKKVPEIEQFLSAGASAQNILMAAHFQGIGAMWRTGSLCFNPFMKKELDMEENESIIGFIYLGTEEGDKRPIKAVEQGDHVVWYKD